MKKEDLVALGLTEEQIAEVQKLNGKDIGVEQKKVEKLELERDNFKGQLETAQTALKEFDGVDVKELNTKITNLTNDLATKESDYQTKIAERDFSDAIKAAITSAGGKSDKAIMAMLDIEALKASKNQKADIKTALEACQKDNDYLFGSNEPFKNPIKPTVTPTSGTDPNTAALRAAMGLKPTE